MLPGVMGNLLLPGGGRDDERLAWGRGCVKMSGFKFCDLEIHFPVIWRPKTWNIFLNYNTICSFEKNNQQNFWTEINPLKGLKEYERMHF